MNDAPTVAWLNGELVPFAEAKLPVEDRGLQFGESLYEVIPVTAGKARALAEHAARMQRGAEHIRIGNAPTHEQWVEISKTLVETEGLTEGLLYAQLTGGVTRRKHRIDDRPQPNFVAYVWAFDFPGPAEVEKGMRVATVPDTRWAHCDLKTTMLLPAVLAATEAAGRGADEAILLAGDEVREGSSCNVFMVEDAGVVGVKQSSRILPGITRILMERSCAATNTPLRSEPVDVSRLKAADEVFVTSTSRLVMPVLEIDGKPVGDGRAGPVATALAAQVRRELELD
jgi:D-alanine transaminase